MPAADPSRRYERPDLRWADPDLDAAAAALRRLAAEPAWRAELSATARRLAVERLQHPIDAAHVAVHRRFRNGLIASQAGPGSSAGEPVCLAASIRLPRRSDLPC